MCKCFPGTGKGGECIWGGKFEDELRDILKVFFIIVLVLATSNQMDHKCLTVYFANKLQFQ